ncbi:MAG: hypothetical protein HYS07_05430 [Chlamydiae bacterium]|nr:hypothetical protein [Chlamydiota bacterium]MBI3278029.1 hypothetical protein [Chlamydiota bacterium]
MIQKRKFFIVLSWVVLLTSFALLLVLKFQIGTGSPVPTVHRFGLNTLIEVDLAFGFRVDYA